MLSLFVRYFRFVCLSWSAGDFFDVKTQHPDNWIRACSRFERRSRKTAFQQLGIAKQCVVGASQVYGGVMRTELARQERMGPQGVGWARLSRQTSTAVR